MTLVGLRYGRQQAEGAVDRKYIPTYKGADETKQRLVAALERHFDYMLSLTFILRREIDSFFVFLSLQFWRAWSRPACCYLSFLSCLAAFVGFGM